MKKKYKKPEIVFEKLAFKSALATCGFVSTKRIEDAFSCAMVEGDDWIGGKGEPTAVGEIPDWVLIGDNDGTCTDYFYCYHVPEVMMEEGNKAYIGLS